MTRVLTVVGHIGEPSYGVLQLAAARAGWTTELVRPCRGEALPAVDDLCALAVLGGPQSAYDTADHPYLRTEIDYLAQVHDAGIPQLAICLGSQLLAVALGGDALPGEAGLECGFIDVTDDDPQESGLPLAGRYFSFHTDRAEPPASATVLARSDRYLQSWRVQNSLAIQFHPELDAAGIDELLAIEGDKLARFGIDVAGLRAATPRELASPSPGETLLSAWFDALPDTLRARSN